MERYEFDMGRPRGQNFFWYVDNGKIVDLVLSDSLAGIECADEFLEVVREQAQILDWDFAATISFFTNEHTEMWDEDGNSVIWTEVEVPGSRWQVGIAGAVDRPDPPVGRERRKGIDALRNPREQEAD